MRRGVNGSFADVLWEKCVFQVFRNFKPEKVAHNLRTFLSVLGPVLVPLDQKIDITLIVHIKWTTNNVDVLIKYAIWMGGMGQIF